MPKFRKKPVVIEAVKWTGDNWDEIEKFSPYGIKYNYPATRRSLSITTLEGEMTAECGDWIIKGIKGEFYPIKNDIFLETYEKVD
jgi:hypothetical protein